MLILPAIDLRGGRCVRLRQGDYQQETVFDDDPAAVAARFRDAGAKWLHVVDLDGAREGSPQNLDVVGGIMAAVGGAMAIEVGGGIRRTEDVARMLDMGARRVIVGTRAIREPDWLREIAEQFPRRVALSLDARGGQLAIEGWQNMALDPQTIQELVDMTEEQLLAAGLSRQIPKHVTLAAIIYTDIARDGMMSGPNVETTAALVKASPFPVLASGGVTTADDLGRLKAVGAAGAIIGRALYEGKITLEAAIEAAGAQQ